MTDKLSIALQENLLSLICFSIKSAPLIRNSIPLPLYSSQLYREVVSRAYDYLDQYKVPAADHLPDLFEDELKGDNATEYGELFASLYEQKENVNEEYVLSKLESFVRQQTLKSSIIGASEAIQEGDLDRAEEQLNKGLRTRLSLFSQGLSLADGVRLAYAREVRRNIVPTGITELDKWNLGPARGELHLFIAAPKRGKCIAANELVLLPNGQRKRIADVVRDRDPEVLSLNEEDGTLVVTKVAKHWSNGKKQCFRLVTRTGRRILATEEHLYLTETGWVKVGDLRVGVDRIAVPRELAGLGSGKEDPRRLRALGYLMADGCLTQPTPFLTKHNDKDPVIVRDFTQCVREAFGDNITHDKDQITHYIVNNKSCRCGHNQNATRAWLQGLGLMGKKSKEKHIPDFVFTLSDDLIVEFLRALFSCDGSVYASGDGAVIDYSSSSPVLAEGVYHLLLRLGIVGKLGHRIAVLDGKSFPYVWVALRDRDNILLFLDKVGFIGKKQALAKQLRLGLEDYRGRGHRGLYGCRSWTDQILFDGVVSVEDAGEHETYDLAVKEHHNFIASDMVVHNTWWLINMAKWCLLSRLRVVYITLEISEAQIAQRMIQCLFSVMRHKAKVPVTNLVVDGLGRLMHFNKDILTGRLSLDDRSSRPVVEKKLGRFRGKENMIIKAFPTGGLTVHALTAYLDMLEQASGFVPDMVIVDYPDLIKVDTKNYRIDLGAIYRDLRGVAVERNIGVLCASQSNRTGASAKLITDIHAGEDFSKIATADTVLTYTQTVAEREMGLARIFVSNSRVGDKDRFIVLISQSYPVGQFVLSSALMTDTYNGLLEQAAQHNGANKGGGEDEEE